MNDEPKQITKLVKKTLAAKYGHINVSVKRGRGTAWGWVEATVELDAPETPSQAIRTAETQEAMRLVYEAMAKAGLKFYTYTSDDGYDTQRDEFLLQLRYRRAA